MRAEPLAGVEPAGFVSSILSLSFIKVALQRLI
jgi:hypothetical protein